MSAAFDVGFDLGPSDPAELLVADASLARALFEGVSAARLLARARIARDERDLAAPNSGGRVTFTFDSVMARACGGNAKALDRVKQAVARHSRAASSEGPLPAQDGTLAALVYAVAVAPDPDASIAEAFIETTDHGLSLRAAEEIGAFVGDVCAAAKGFDPRLGSSDPRGALFEACLRLSAQATAGPWPAARLIDASRRLFRSELGVALLRPSQAPLYPRSIDAELPRVGRGMAQLDRVEIDHLLARSPQDLAAALARIDASSGAPRSALTLDRLMADVSTLMKRQGTLVLARAEVPQAVEDPVESARPSWQPTDWAARETVQGLASALERGTMTLPRAWVAVTRGGDAALDAVGAEMLEIPAHSFASAAFSEILARSARPRDVMRLVTYFAVAPDPHAAARTLALCQAAELPSVLRAWLEALLPTDGGDVPFRADPETSRGGRLSACVSALKPYPHLFSAVSPLLVRVSDHPPLPNEKST